MTDSGYQRYVDALSAVAERTAEPGLAGVLEDLRAPVRFGVAGRPGVGCSTVARALRAAGLAVADGMGAAPPDVDVYVLAEAAKPEDRRALAASVRPGVAVLNKADLTRSAGREPLAAAAELGRLLESQSGVPTRPLVGLLADPAVDDELVAALRIIADEPADLGSIDRFVEAPHRLPRAVRERLLNRLDLFGIAHAVLAVRQGCGRERIVAALRRVSGAAELEAAIDGVSAPLRYRRIMAARPRLLELSAGARGARTAELLCGDDVVVAAMAAAVDAVTAAGMTVASADSPDALRRRAVWWQRYARGPVSRMHHACAGDIARGSLRLWARAGGVAADLP